MEKEERYKEAYWEAPINWHNTACKKRNIQTTIFSLQGFDKMIKNKTNIINGQSLRSY